MRIRPLKLLVLMTGVILSGPGSGGAAPDSADDSFWHGLPEAGSMEAGPADAFGCLRTSREIVDLSSEIVTGESQLEDGTVVPDGVLWFGASAFRRLDDGAGIDARGTVIVTPALAAPPKKEYRKWYPLMVRGGLDSICIAGGSYPGRLPLDIGWHDSKGGRPDAVGENSAPIAFSSTDTTVSGVHIRNNHDGIRPHSSDGKDASGWSIRHSWIEYNRDDCVEADGSRGSGGIYDSLFDGCYVGLSTRACNDCDRTGDTYTLDRVLLRMEPMPFPFRWWERYQDAHLYPDDRPARNAGRAAREGIPFGHGTIFKLNGNEDANPRFVIRDSMFLLQQLYPSHMYSFPPSGTITECRNLTIVWAGRESLERFRERFAVPAACEGEVEITGDLGVWRSAVADWHERHPRVGANAKPEIMGDIRIPRWDPRPWPQ